MSKPLLVPSIINPPLAQMTAPRPTSLLASPHTSLLVPPPSSHLVNPSLQFTSSGDLATTPQQLNQVSMINDREVLKENI